MNISKRVNGIKVSSVRKLDLHQDEAIKKGKTVYHLNIGQPDLPTPKEYFEYIEKSDEKILSYADSKGNLGLRQAMSDFYKETFNLDYNEEEILITAGGSEAIQFVLTSIFDIGDEVLIVEPYYANYNNFFEMLEININTATSTIENGFHLPPRDELVSKITPKTKAIFITSPGNPTGTVYTREELKMLVDIALEYKLYIISDEVYRLLGYDGREVISMGSFKEAKENVIIIESVSKTYSACGARVGSVTTKNKELLKQIYKLCQIRLSVSSLDMIGAEGLYRVLKKSYFEENRKIYEARRNAMYEGLLEIEGVIVGQPEGAFYIIVELPVDDSEKFAIWLLDEFSIDNETVMITPAQGFYKTPELGKKQVRISYCIEEEKIKKALKIFKKALEEYTKNY